MSRHIPRKRFGQHFLHDRQIIQRIINSLFIKDNDTWVEIGPGQGALTNALPKNIQQLYLVEIDRDLAGKLEKTYAENSNICIINEDILKVDFKRLIGPGQRIRLLGNLPYNISTPIFFHLANFDDCISDMTFMVQKEVADRLVAEPGSKNYGRLSLSAGLRYDIAQLFNVGPGAFNPPPKVNSSVIRLTPSPEKYELEQKEHFDNLVKTAFSQRRKTLRNSLGKLMSTDCFEQAGIDPGLRPETLSKADFLKLAARMI